MVFHFTLFVKIIQDNIIFVCYDIDYEKYIIVKTDIDRIYKLLTQNITMRDIIIMESEFLDVSILGEEDF